MIVLWKWNAHKVFNNFQRSFFLLQTILLRTKGASFFFTKWSIKLPKKKECKKNIHGLRHTICDSFLLFFEFCSRPFLPYGLLLAACFIHIDIAAMCVYMNLFSAYQLFGLLFANFCAYDTSCINYKISDIDAMVLPLIEVFFFFREFIMVPIDVNFLINKNNQNKLVAWLG